MLPILNAVAKFSERDVANARGFLLMTMACSDAFSAPAASVAQDVELSRIGDSARGNYG
jgi:hypothetical protein